jgi:hypothetical protein
MSAVLVLICGIDADDVRVHPPEFCGRRIISARLEQTSYVRPHRGPHWIQMLLSSTGPAIHVLIQPVDERVLVVRVATDINPVMHNV